MVQHQNQQNVCISLTLSSNSAIYSVTNMQNVFCAQPTFNLYFTLYGASELRMGGRHSKFRSYDMI